MRMKTNDGTPDAVKVACPVWNGGKGGDNFKALPIAINPKKYRWNVKKERVQCESY